MERRDSLRSGDNDNDETIRDMVSEICPYSMCQIKLLLNISTNNMKSIITVTAITVKNFSVKQLVRTTFATSHK